VARVSNTYLQVINARSFLWSLLSLPQHTVYAKPSFEIPLLQPDPAIPSHTQPYSAIFSRGNQLRTFQESYLLSSASSLHVTRSRNGPPSSRNLVVTILEPCAREHRFVFFPSTFDFRYSKVSLHDFEIVNMMHHSL